MPGSIVGGIFGNKAAGAQADAAEDAGDVQERMFERSIELSEPWRTAGVGALGALNFELGLGGTERPLIGGTDAFNVGDESFSTREAAEDFRNTLISNSGGTSGGGVGEVIWDDKELVWRVDRNAPGPTSQDNVLAGAGAGGADVPGITESTTGGNQYLGFQETPGYQFQMDEGQKAINRSLAARGKLLSGPAVKEGLRFSQGLADQTYSNHLARLSNLAGLGANTANQQGAFGVKTGQGIADSLIEGGNARASGYAATGKAISGGINALAFGFGGV